ncbi:MULTISPECIES: hypothetical protein [Actinomycetes]|uniref:Uncharacterized protein n=2 Tax=Actinomycetes TaxID=1760 RepID=A0ABP5ZYM5_9ACTN
MRSSTTASVGQRGTPWGWFLAWAAVGACAALGLAALLSVGVLLLAASALVLHLLARRRGN